MNLYHYQKTRHVRTQTPYPYKNFSSFKITLQVEFNNTCVYCRTPHHLSEEAFYAVEHYRPRKMFPELENDYNNLYYACGHCNSKKSSFWPTDDQLQAGLYIPNPCEHVMHQHLRASRDGTVEFHSDAGKWTVDLLDLNTPKRVQKKLFYIRVYLDTKRQVVRYEKLLTKIASIIEDRNVDTPQNIESLYERTLTEYEELVSSLNFLENGSS